MYAWYVQGIVRREEADAEKVRGKEGKVRQLGVTVCQCKDFRFIQSETKNNPHLNDLNRVVRTQLRC